MMENKWEKKKVLITVKAYPQSSKKYVETVCTAGITSEGEWIRIYPIPFRYLDKNLQFKKYQWIEVELQRNPNDNRIQSYRPRIESLKIISDQLPTKNGWELRNEIVLKTVSPSLEYLKENYPNTSLGIIKPKKIIDLIVEEVPASQINEFQQLMFVFSEHKTDISSPLTPLNYKFSSVFRNRFNLDWLPFIIVIEFG